jgi:hypothetical protein
LKALERTQEHESLVLEIVLGHEVPAKGLAGRLLPSGADERAKPLDNELCHHRIPQHLS